MLSDKEFWGSYWVKQLGRLKPYPSILDQSSKIINKQGYSQNSLPNELVAVTIALSFHILMMETLFGLLG